MSIESGGNKNVAGACKQTSSWSEVLGRSLPCWNKNVLEIVLEKDQRGPFVVNDQECARIFSKICLDKKYIEEVQICPNGRGIVLVTLKPEITAGSFCTHEIFEVTSSGIRAVHMRPAGKREIVATLRGLHPNTRDDEVLRYLSKYAKVVTGKVVYGVYSDGPLSGLKTGDRSYKL